MFDLKRLLEDTVNNIGRAISKPRPATTNIGRSYNKELSNAITGAIQRGQQGARSVQRPMPQPQRPQIGRSYNPVVRQSLGFNNTMAQNRDNWGRAVGEIPNAAKAVSQGIIRGVDSFSAGGQDLLQNITRPILKTNTPKTVQLQDYQPINKFTNEDIKSKVFSPENYSSMRTGSELGTKTVPYLITGNAAEAAIKPLTTKLVGAGIKNFAARNAIKGVANIVPDVVQSQAIYDPNQGSRASQAAFSVGVGALAPIGGEVVGKGLSNIAGFVAKNGKNIPAGLSIKDISKDVPVKGGQIPGFPEHLDTTNVIRIERNGKVIGGIDAVKDRFDPQNLRVNKIMISPESQGKGIGTEEITKLFKDNPDVNKITGNATAEARPFWEKLGAKFPEDRTKTYFTLDKPTVVKGGQIDPLIAEARKYKSADEFINAKINKYHGSPETTFKLDRNKPLFLTNDATDANTYAGGGREWQGIKASGKTFGFHAPEGKTLDLNDSATKSKVLSDILGGSKLQKKFSEIPDSFEFWNPSKGEPDVMFPKRSFDHFYEWSAMANDTGKQMKYGLPVRTGSYSFDEVGKKNIQELNKAFDSYGRSDRNAVYSNWDKIIKYAKDKGYDYVDHTTESPGKEITFPETVAVNPGKILSKSQLKDLWNKSQVSAVKGGVDIPKPSVAESILGGKKASNIETPFGFNQSAKGSEFVSPQAKAKLEGGGPVRLNEELQDTVAAKLSKMDDIKAHDFALKTKSDEGTTAAIQLAQKYRKQGNFDLEASLINEKAARLREAGREVQAAALVDKLSPEGVVSSAAQTIQRYNATAKKPIAELTGDMAKKFSEQAQTIEKMTDGREKQLALWTMKQDLLNLVPSTLVDKAVTVWKAGLLTSLRTHERNLLGNTIMSAAEVAKDLPAAIADKAMSLATGKRTLTAQARGLGEFMSKKTRQEISDLVVHGVDLSDDISKYEVNHVTWADTPIQQGLKKITDAVFRPLGAEDRAFYNAAYARSLYDQAGAAAKNAKDISIVKKLVANPTDDMLLNATKDANYATFHDKNALTKVAGGIKRAARSIPGAGGEAGKALTEVLAPFTGVPSSIVGKTLAYSPLGLVKGAVNVGRVLAKDVPSLQRQAAQEIGRGVVGTGLFGLGAYLMSKGLMTGQPKDKKEADLWAAQGKQANSVLVGGKWRSINSIGPQNLVMLAGAKLKEEMDRPDGDIGSYLGKLGKDQLSQTFLAGVQGPLNAITDPARYGKSYVGNQSASIVPNIIKDVSKAFDPLQRENNTIGDYFQNSIPGLRNQNIPKRDVLGQEMKQEPTGINAFIDLFNSKTPKDSATLNELDRLFKAGQEATPASVGKSFKVAGVDFKLDPKQLNELEAQSGNQLIPKLNELVTSESYSVATDEEKKNAIGDVVKAVKDTVKEDYALGTSGTKVSTSKVNLGLEKAAFEKSDKAYEIKDGMVYTRNTDGSAATPVTEAKFSYDIGKEYLQKYSTAKDLDNWMTTAQGQLDNIGTQLKDKNLDPKEKLALMNDAQTLVNNMAKYQSYGGFTKGSSGGSGGTSKAATKTSMERMIKMLETNTSSNSDSQKALRNIVKGINIKARKV